MLLQSLVEIIPPPMYLRYFGIISAWKESVIPKLEESPITQKCVVAQS